MPADVAHFTEQPGIQGKRRFLPVLQCRKGDTVPNVECGKNGVAARISLLAKGVRVGRGGGHGPQSAR
jgi:hypothetical protein